MGLSVAKRYNERYHVIILVRYNSSICNQSKYNLVSLTIGKRRVLLVVFIDTLSCRKQA